jgi:S1-C subfamily serine protease
LKSFGVTTEAGTVGLLPVVKVVSVARGSAAEKAGLKAGDAITEINDRVVFAPDLLEDALGKAGPRFTLTLLDDQTGEKSSLKVDLDR